MKHWSSPQVNNLFNKKIKIDKNTKIWITKFGSQWKSIIVITINPVFPLGFFFWGGGGGSGSLTNREILP